MFTEMMMGAGSGGAQGLEKGHVSLSQNQPITVTLDSITTIKSFYYTGYHSTYPTNFRYHAFVPDLTYGLNYERGRNTEYTAKSTWSTSSDAYGGLKINGNQITMWGVSNYPNGTLELDWVAEGT